MRQQVSDGDAGRGAGTGVADGDGEADLVTGAEPGHRVSGLATSMVAHRTAVEADAESVPSLVAVALAVLLYVVQLVELVAAVTWTWRLAPAARLIGWPASVSCWLPSAPVIANEAACPKAGSMTQWTGFAALPPGSASVRVTPVALPWPVLATVTLKPIGLPAETDAASAVLVTSMVAHRTAVEADAESVPSLVAVRWRCCCTWCSSSSWCPP